MLEIGSRPRQRLLAYALERAAWMQVEEENRLRKIAKKARASRVDFGHWHFHLCIGEYRGPRHNPASAELARYRRTAQAE